jgi:hypothetical protein
MIISKRERKRCPATEQDGTALSSAARPGADGDLAFTMKLTCIATPAAVETG